MLLLRLNILGVNQLVVAAIDANAVQRGVGGKERRSGNHHYLKKRSIRVNNRFLPLNTFIA
jgi:hypothetical protein